MVLSMAGRDESLFVCPKEQQQELLVALNPQRDVEVDLNLKVDVTPIPPLRAHLTWVRGRLRRYNCLPGDGRATQLRHILCQRLFPKDAPLHNVCDQYPITSHLRFSVSLTSTGMPFAKYVSGLGLPSRLAHNQSCSFPSSGTFQSPSPSCRRQMGK